MVCSKTIDSAIRPALRERKGWPGGNNSSFNNNSGETGENGKSCF